MPAWHMTDNPRHHQALAEIATVYERYDLAGGCVIVDAQEMSYKYVFPTTWNVFVKDPTLPMGFRIRAKSDELGHERAHEFVEGAAWTMGALRDFARQTEIWMRDLMQMLRKNGVRLTYTPFGGKRLPRLTEQARKAR